MEKLAFHSLPIHKQTAASSLLYPGECWDCKVNHYEGFDWDEMSDDIKEAWGVLGWNQNNWELGGPYPASENKNWGQLSQEEKEAAGYLCYNESIWSSFQ